MKNLKGIIVGVLVVALIGFAAFNFFTSDLEHIEDTNGVEDFSLQEINDSNIIKMNIGSLNLIKGTSALSMLPEYSSSKFTGVEEIYSTNMTGNRFDITVYNLLVEQGNLKVVLLHNNEIVHEFKLNELTQSFTLENPDGEISLRVAGESANFKLVYDLV